LWKLMRADWYAKVWAGKTVPTDLEDPLLAEVWLARIQAMPPEQLRDERVRQMLAQSRYRREGAWSTGSLLDACSLPQLAELGTPRTGWMAGASASHQQRLMQWVLFGGQGQVPTQWMPWFAAARGHEAAVARYLIEEGFPPHATTRPWVVELLRKGLLEKSLIERWVGEDDADAVALFEWLPAARRNHLWAVWQKDRPRLVTALGGNLAAAITLCKLGAIGVDLETDGQAIWQAGCATVDQAELMFDDRSSVPDLDRAMQLLAARMQASPLVVGHNFLAWDLPVIRRHVDGLVSPPVWDTLLVQFLLEPQAASHGLGSNHQAHDDAEAARRLFDKQCTRVPHTWAARLLAGDFDDDRQMLRHVIDSLTGTHDYARSAPPWLHPAGDAGAVQVLPEDQVHEVDWVPGVTVVRAHPTENLARDFLQIDADLLARALPGESGLEPRAQVLLAVAREATGQGIALRFGMIPPWLLEGNATLVAAVRLASFEPPPETRGRRVAPLPQDATPMLAAGPTHYLWMGPALAALVTDRRSKAASEWTSLAAKDGPTSAPLLCVANERGERVWVQADLAARTLSRGTRWRSFRVHPMPSDMQGPTPMAARSVQPARARLLVRQGPVLHPGSHDQATYWQEVIRAVRSIGGAQGREVPILLVESSSSAHLVRLLAGGIAAMQWGEARPDYHGRSEHLRRAQRHGHIVVDLRRRWPQWLTIARAADIRLLPVLEALPLDEWFALRQTALAPELEVVVADPVLVDDVGALLPDQRGGNEDEGDFDGGDDVEGDGRGVPVAEPTAAGGPPPAGQTGLHPVSASTLLRHMPGLIREFLQPWLMASGLDPAQHAVVLIDARASGIHKELGDCVELLPMAVDTDLTADRLSTLRDSLDALAIQREDAPRDRAAMEEFFVRHWQRAGKDRVRAFTLAQGLAMEAICVRESDVLVALPTGSGKSALFQVPALCRGLRNRRLTLVISPLRALMADQVEELRQQGFCRVSGLPER
jgi:hypothetical protein